jgi:hypothetical protein
VFCLKVEYYLDNNKQLKRSDAANATAMDQHAESVFDFFDKAEKDKTPIRLTLMGIDDTINLAQMTLAYQEEGIHGLLGGKKKEKDQQEGQKPPPMGADEEVRKGSGCQRSTFDRVGVFLII